MRSILILISLLASIGLHAQKKKFTRAEYIAMYKDMAMEEMGRTGIPASIKLAQGILESGDGNSTLAVKAKNHFGIKCHDWIGPSIKHDDDAKNECFRKYKSAEQSYIDHSDFLTGKSRYSSLFELEQTDYKGWAKGLKKAGYATSPTYAKAIIGIIEDNELYQYDQQVLAGGKITSIENSTATITSSGRNILFNNRVKYIVAQSGDTYASITEELSMFEWQLPRYNEVQITDTLSAGDMVYLQPKRKRTYGKQKTHMVAEGENIHSISQKYGIKEEKLRQRNKIPEDYEPEAGVILVLKGRLKGSASPAIVPSKNKKVIPEKDPVDEPDFKIEYDLGS
jgi:LysM repeat protein